MWKRFFARSSGSINGDGNNDLLSPQSDDEKVYWESPWEGGVYDRMNYKVDNRSRNPKDVFSKPRKQLLENQNSAPSPGLRRSRSLSSAAFHGGVLEERNLGSSELSRSPLSSNRYAQPHSCEYPVRCVSHTPEKKSKSRRGEGANSQRSYAPEKPVSPCTSRSCVESSVNSSYSLAPVPLKCRSARLAHVSDKILDLYIDGEQQGNGKSSKKNTSSSLKPLDNENRGGIRPPRVQSISPASPTGSSKDKPRSNSREVRDVHLPPCSRDWMKNELEPESPQKLAKNVVERLSQVYPQKPKIRSRDFYPDSPTTVEDIFEQYSDPHAPSNLDEVSRRSFHSDGPSMAMSGYHGEGPYFQDQSAFLGNVPEGVHSVQMEEDTDMELHIKAKEAEERVMLLSEDLEPEEILKGNSFTVSELLQTIRNLAEERRNLALDVSAHLQCRIDERANAKEAIRAARSDLDSRTRRLEKEKSELQSGLERELDRRSSDWSFKLGKYQSEEQRLRDRVRELAEQNVSLQLEVSSYNEKEMESQNRITHIEVQLKDLTERWQAATLENDDLHEKLSELQENLRGAEADRDCLKRSYKEKEKETTDFQKIVARLQRTRSEQDKTISGLRQGLSEDIIERKEYDNQVVKLQMELVRLTGVEQSLRREMESCSFEVESLRHENISLLSRLQDSGTESGFSSFKLDRELQARVECLQNQGLPMFEDCSRLCAKLLESVKRNTSQKSENVSGVKQVEEAKMDGMDGYFIVESDMKVQNFERGIENLKRSLNQVIWVLHEKSKPVRVGHNSPGCDGSELKKQIGESIEDNMGLKLKAEILLTSVLRENLVSKQMELEQLQAELATAIRGHDILRCEVQGALDTLSCVSHKMKDLELQMMRKDENINQLKSELQESTKELTITNNILPKVSEERDVMWEEVKQYSEKNMLLSSEVNLLKKKIESLEEDILVKEGEMTILKDSLNNKAIDLFYSP